MTNQVVNLETIEHAKQKLIDLTLEFGPKVAVAILILIAGYFVGRWLGKIVDTWLGKLDLEPPVRWLIVRVARLLVLTGFLLLALDNLNVKIGPVLAGLGVAGAGIALAMQGVLGNLAAGLVIIFTKPFRVSEYVEMAGVEGRVETIELFCTKLSHPDRSTIVVPNRKIVGEILHNYGKIRQLEVIVGVAYSTDLNLALAAVNDVLNRSAHVLKDPAPVVRVAVLADSSINIAVKPWVPVVDFVAAGGEITKAVVEEFRERGISISFPQREVRLLNSPS